ncbi:MAG: HAMP domain-containing protein [Firmicutes bacterium]|nr:HAMP domain-containing protein [Bacillota bacterium]
MDRFGIGTRLGARLNTGLSIRPATKKLVAKLRSIRVRLTGWYVFLLAAILIGFSILVYISMERSLCSDLDATLQAKAAQVEAAVKIVPGGLAIMEDVINHPGNLGGLENRNAPPASVSIPFVVLDTAGDLKISSGFSSRVLPVGPDVVGPAIHGNTLFGTVKIEDRESLRFLSAPLEVNGRRVGVVVVGRSLYSLESTLARLRLILASLILSALVFAGISGYLMAWRALAPIDTITRTARKITAEDLSLRLNLQGVSVDDELGRLARTFDEMLSRLDEQFQRERQFTADVSHELRTPLTVIRSTSDVALRDPGPTMDGYRMALSSIRDEAMRLSRIVDDLLFFARADFRQVRLNLEPVDIDGFMGEVFDYGVRLAASKGIALEAPEALRAWESWKPREPWESWEPGAVVVEGDRSQLMRMFINLIDNAVKYTPPGGKVSIETYIETYAEGDFACVVVRDTGPGIPPEELPKIFDRFYRVDRSRARADSGCRGAEATGGTGLGLSIAKTIAELHGGNITVESEPGRGSAFKVTLPLFKETGCRGWSGGKGGSHLRPPEFPGMAGIPPSPYVLPDLK